ncbi:MAG: SAM-dependent methyltransferase [candidate division WOR-3 bacterium]
MRFDEFLSEVLYNPKKGYYFRKKIGEDYYTSISFEKLFSWTFANYFINLNIENILEIGANEGYFAKEAIEFYKMKNKKLNYFILERAMFKEIEGVKYIKNLKELKEFDGVIFQNEVLDAIEFRRFIYKDGEWKELYVRDFKEFYIDEIKDKEIIKYLPENVFEGLIYDVSIKALEFLKEQVEILRKGFIVIVDYGYERDEIIERFPNGSLTTYYKHSVSDNPFENLYEQDITYFLDWTLIKNFLKGLNVDIIVFENQGKFLLENGILEIAEIISKNLSELERFKIFNKVKSLVFDFHNFYVLIGAPRGT